VIRNRKIHIIHQTKVLVGDIVKLEEGMEMPADGIVVEAAELTADESAMTGETDPLKKYTFEECLKRRDEIIDEGSKNSSGRHEVPSPVILGGTRLLTGEGKMLVIVVGDSSSIGKISAFLR
jgi:magnesium-transporting ATPase (P-type)